MTANSVTNTKGCQSTSIDTKSTPTLESISGYESLVSSNDNDDERHLSLLVGGVHCALCIQKIESALLSQAGVKNVRLNFSTGRLEVVWMGASDLANDFVKIVSDLGYQVQPYNPDREQQTADAQSRFLLLCMGVAGFAMGNIMLLSLGLWIAGPEHMEVSTRSLLHWFSALIGIPAILFSGRPFFRSAIAVLKKRQTNMDVPISIALILATGMSLFETINHGEYVYFDSAVMLMFFLLVGRYLDFRARRNATSAATDLMKTLSGFATVIDDDGTRRRLLIRDIRERMRVAIAAGEKVPVDGIVEQGASDIDTSLITGETLPRSCGIGDQLFAGTINQTAPLTLRVEKAAEDSLLSDIVRLMEKAEQSNAEYVRLADKAARYYTPVVHLFALAAFILWFGFLGAVWQDALLIAVTVLIITCPCALGLAVPVVQVLATGRLMKSNILVKSGDALERLSKIDTVLFDKTGTLTYGVPKLSGEYDQEDLKLAASLAQHSNHPLSKALTQGYKGDLVMLDEVLEVAGQGVQGKLRNDIIKIGKGVWASPDYVSEHNDFSEIVLSVNGAVRCVFYFADQLRVDAKDVVDGLKYQNIECVLVSGDRHDVVEKTASTLGIERFYAATTPIEKEQILQDFKKQERSILMVGDGLNDAAVLAGADVSIAPGTAVDMAQNVADIVVMGDALKPVSIVHRVAKLTQKLVKQNFAIAIIYNFIAIPLAFAGLVTPMIAAIAMSGSSIIVIANSYRLKFNEGRDD